MLSAFVFVIALTVSGIKAGRIPFRASAQVGHGKRIFGSQADQYASLFFIPTGNGERVQQCKPISTEFY